MAETSVERLLEMVNDKLDVLITLNAVSMSANQELDNPTKVRLLYLAKFMSKEIGSMLGIRADSVRRIRGKWRGEKLKRAAPPKPVKYDIRQAAGM
jgi:hypothetical protein